MTFAVDRVGNYSEDKAKSIPWGLCFVVLFVLVGCYPVYAGYIVSLCFIGIMAFHALGDSSRFIPFFLFLSIFQPVPEKHLGLWGGIAIGDVILSGFAILGILRVAQNHRLVKDRIMVWWLILTGSVSLSLFWGYFGLGITPGFRDIAEVLRYPTYLLWYFCGYQVRLAAGKPMKRGLRWIALLIFAEMVAATVLYWDKTWWNRSLSSKSLFDLYSTSGARAKGTFYNPNWLGVFLAFSSAFFVANVVVFRRKFTTWIYLVGLLWLGYLVIQSGSRTSAISCLAAIVTILYFFTRLRNISKVRFLLMILLLGTGITISMQELPLNRRFRVALDAIEKRDLMKIREVSERYELLVLYLPHALRSPIIGLGPARGEVGSIFDNNYLLLFLRYGFIGLVLHLYLLLVLTKRTVSALRRAPTEEDSILQLTFLGMTVALAVSMISGEFMNVRQIMAIYIFMGAFIGRRAEMLLRDADKRISERHK